MNYEGKLYGKVGKTYFPLELTTKDIDEMEARLLSFTPSSNVPTDAVEFSEWIPRNDWHHNNGVGNWYKNQYGSTDYTLKTTAQLYDQYLIWKEQNAKP
jgi:hypothetical protein